MKIYNRLEIIIPIIGVLLLLIALSANGEYATPAVIYVKSESICDSFTVKAFEIAANNYNKLLDEYNLYRVQQGDDPFTLLEFEEINVEDGTITIIYRTVK